MKNNNNIYRWGVILVFCISLVSCKKAFFYDGINTDPTQLKKASPKSLLPGIISSSGYLYGGDETRFSTIFVQHMTGAANQSYSTNIYNITPDDVDNMWAYGFYGGIMNNNYDMMRIAKESNAKNYHAIAEVLMANTLQRTTDLWGDIPYANAFNGQSSRTTAYQSQQEIYDAIFSLLNSAIFDITQGDASPEQPSSEDMIYAGDITKWAKFAHGMKARAFLHLRKKNVAYIDSVIKEVGLALSSNDDNAAVKFNGLSIAASNPIYQFNTQRADIVYTGYVQDLLSNAKDPRYQVYYDSSDKTSLGALYGSATAPVNLMTYEEIKFIEAEAQFIKGNMLAAATAYNEGVKVSLLRTVGNSSYAATIEKTALTISLEDIMTQKYIALFLSPESWTDWRRTGLPVLTASQGNITGGVIPRSLSYPSSEIRYNRSNVPNTTRRLIDRIWWDTEN